MRLLVWILAAAALVAGTLFYLASLSQRRTSGFVDRGYGDWQAGRLREAELAWRSALERDPGNRRAAILLGRMLLQQGRREEARRWFRELLAAASGPARAEVALLYLDALLSVGWFEELAVLCLAEAPHLEPTLGGFWARVAFEALRATAAAPQADEEIFSLWPIGPAAVLEARINQRLGQPAAAIVALARARGHSLAPPLRFAAARLALELGQPDQARFFLNAAAERLSPDQIAFNELWLAAPRDGFSNDLMRRLLAQSLPPGLPSWERLRRLGELLSIEAPGLAGVLDEHFRDDGDRLDRETVLVLWLQWEVSHPEKTPNPWQGRLVGLLGYPVLRLGASSLTPERFTALLNTLPLPRDTVIALLARVRAPVAASS